MKGSTAVLAQCPERLLGLLGFLGLLVGVTLAALSPFSASWALAQQQPPASGAVTVTGVVLDAGSGAPVEGAFLAIADRGPRAIAGAQGRFALPNVPAGTHELLVQRFGYRDLRVRLVVTDSMAPLALRLEPDPLAIEGLTVRGDARVSVSGLVLDAVSDEPVPWTELWLSRDLRRQHGRAAADAQGVFRIPNVETGGYFLRVERLGYESQYVMLELTAPPVPLEIRLRPDSAVLAGLETMERQLRSRRAASGFITQSFGENRLRLSPERGMRRFLENDGLLHLIPCSDRSVSRDCLEVRTNRIRPYVLIDEMPAFGLDQLDSYDPRELYAVDFFMCGSRAAVIRAYTYEFMDRMARRPRLLLHACDRPLLPMP